MGKKERRGGGGEQSRLREKKREIEESIMAMTAVGSVMC